jgi:iron complex transport system ATP-binding protein
MMLDAENITVGYKNKVVLVSLSLSIFPGKLTVLAGPNGSGKSTLLRCLAGALPPQQGKVILEGKDLYRLPVRTTSRQIAYVSQETAMPFAFTVKELVDLADGVGGTPESIRRAIELLQLENIAPRALDALSGGEQQRAAIARGLAQQTPCLLLDEPTAHLDLRYQAALFQALGNRCREEGATVVVVLHDLSLAVRHADQIVLLNKGRIVGNGPVAEVMREDTLAQVYQIPVRIRRDGAEIVAVTPADDLTFS